MDSGIGSISRIYHTWNRPENNGMCDSMTTSTHESPRYQWNTVLFIAKLPPLWSNKSGKCLGVGFVPGNF